MPKTPAKQRPLTRPRRSRAVNAKLTPDDHDLIAAKAESCRLTPTEWTRTVAVSFAQGPDPVLRVLLEEVFAIRSLLGNVISYLATDGELPKKIQLKDLADRADATKFARAQAALNRIEEQVLTTARRDA